MKKSSYYTSLFFLLPLFYFLSAPIYLEDLNVWIALGRTILSSGTLYPPESFSLKPIASELAVYPSWGLSVFYAWIYSFSPGLGGLKFVFLFHRLLLLLLLFILYRSSLAQKSFSWTIKNILIIFFSLYGLSYIFIDRPAFVATLPFLLIFVFLYQKERLSSWQRVSFLGLVFLLANIHASVFLVIFLLLWKILSSFILKNTEKLKESIFLFFTTLLFIHLNPWGYKIWLPFFKTSFFQKGLGQISSVQFVGEWTSALRLNNPSTEIAYFFLVAGILFYLLKKRDKTLFLSPYFPLLFLGFFSTRHLIWPFLTLLPFLFMNAKEVTSDFKEEKKKANSVIVFLLVIFILFLNPFERPCFIKELDKKTFRFDLEKQIPLEEMNILKQRQMTGPILTTNKLSGTVELFLGNKILVDCRNIIFSSEVIADYQKLVLGLPHWEKVLTKYSFEAALLSYEEGSVLIENLKKVGWKENGTSPLYVLLIPPKN